MKNIKKLQEFLIAANKAGYASGKESTWKKEKDHSLSITFVKGDFRFHDNWFGGEPFGGRLVVFYKQKPYWIMVYYGFVVGHVLEVNELYTVLREALKRMPKNAPFRGPKSYKAGVFLYKNAWKGTLEKYQGEEEIRDGKNVVYKASYMGGLVDKREGV